MTTIQKSKEIGKANATNLKEKDFVAVEFRGNISGDFAAHEAFVVDGLLTVSGCLPADSRMVGRQLSRPWRLVGGDDWTIPAGGIRAVLADGTEVIRLPNLTGMQTYSASGREFKSVMAAAMALTPLA